MSQSAPHAFLDLQNVSVVRGETTVLHGINLHVQRGECIAILGANGCGKSTLIKTITRELYPLALPQTRVEIFGRERWDVTELRRRLGVVTSETPSHSALGTTAFDVVLTGFFSSATLWPNLVITPSMRDAAQAAVEQVGASRFAHRELGTLSAGQQKRALIARALVASGDQEGRVLLLDEPSNALDLGAQAELRDTMRRLAREGTGLILVTHHIADIVPEIGRVIFMRDGGILSDGTRGSMLTEENLRELFGVDVNLAERDGYLHAW